MKRHGINGTIAILIFILILLSGCERDISMLSPAGNADFPEVFLDGFAPGLDYSAFANSKLDALDIDNDHSYKGHSSLKITVPYENDPSGWFAGGAFYSTFPRDLSAYNALTFWGKASKTTYADVGFGNDNSGNSLYEVMQSNVLFGSSWKKYIIPLPLPDVLDAETGMFQFAAGADENGLGSTLWFDEVKFENLGTIAYPRINLESKLFTGWVGREFYVNVNGVTFNVNGVDQTVNTSSNYFTLISLNEDIAEILDDRKISAVAEGTAKILVKLGSLAEDTITVQIGQGNGPATPAPIPDRDPGNVLSLFSDEYTDHEGIVWNTYWQYSTAELEEMTLSDDNIKLYTNLNFVGIEFTNPLINASDMTHFHMDIWTPNATTAPAAFKVLLVDFGADGVYGGGDDSSHELTLTSSTNPAIASQQWVSLDIPLSDFTGLTSTTNLAQLVLSGDLSTVFIDNVYFFKQTGGGSSDVTEPATAAPFPTYPAANVIALFSDGYTNVPVDTWSASWDQADVADVQISGNTTKLYTNLVYAGIEFTSNVINASEMTHFRMDVWTPDATAMPVVLKIKLVDFGANGVWNGGSDDVEHELTFNASSSPALVTGQWVTFNIPLSSFTGLTTKGHLAQLIISGDPNTLYIDNILFHK